MPVRARIVESLALDAVGTQVWDGRIGQCETMPTEAWYETCEAASIVFERIVDNVDWKRVMIEATGRHFAAGHPEDSQTGHVCGDCVREALLSEDRWANEVEPAPRRDDGRDWLGILATAREKWKR